ncbi:MAG TPA: alpha/beta hydrolase [Allosphingosinicella sp.]|nr:alpha/beta hydrolase [Allosphingosinicella sp.]
MPNRYQKGLALLAAPLLAASAPPRDLELIDAPRGRAVPVALYGADPGKPRPLALISHGYGGNNRAYSFIAEALVERGYVVASVQHELEGDAPMPATGEPAVVRRPWWDQGAANLLFVIGEMRARGLADRRPVLLVGHSNGGDSSMLFAAQHEAMVSAVFTLDNRRMRMPRTARPRICSVRSSDQPADPGVLPTPAERRRYRMVIGTVPGLIHNDMWDGATAARKQAMLGWLRRCLETSHP